ncbi:hypothetical protein D3C81_1463660 [compost metagenome]
MPDGPTSRNTPTGLPGSASCALAVWIRSPSRASAWSCPITLAASVCGSRITAATSSATIRPTGMPVQSETISATTASFTSVWTSGALARAALSSASISSSWRRASSVVNGSCSGAWLSTRRQASRSLARPSSRCHRPSASASAASNRSRRVLRSAIRSGSSLPGAAPSAASLASSACSASHACNCCRRNSTSFGGAYSDNATRAQAVSSRLIALSGNCREGM